MRRYFAEIQKYDFIIVIKNVSVVLGMLISIQVQQSLIKCLLCLKCILLKVYKSCVCTELLFMNQFIYYYHL